MGELSDWGRGEGRPVKRASKQFAFGVGGVASLRGGGGGGRPLPLKGPPGNPVSLTYLTLTCLESASLVRWISH